MLLSQLHKLISIFYYGFNKTSSKLLNVGNTGDRWVCNYGTMQQIKCNEHVNRLRQCSAL